MQAQRKLDEQLNNVFYSKKGLYQAAVELALHSRWEQPHHRMFIKLEHFGFIDRACSIWVIKNSCWGESERREVCEIGHFVFLFCVKRNKSVWIIMMGGNADDPGYHMLTVTDIMVYFDNCKKVGLNMNMGFQKKVISSERKNSACFL